MRQVRRRDGTFFDCGPGYVLQEGERFFSPMVLMDHSPRTSMTDEQVRDLVAAALRPKDVSKLSVIQLKRAFVATKMANDDVLSRPDAYVEGAFAVLAQGERTSSEADYIASREADEQAVRRDAATDLQTARDTAAERSQAISDVHRRQLSEAWRRPESAA